MRMFLEGKRLFIYFKIPLHQSMIHGFNYIHSAQFISEPKGDILIVFQFIQVIYKRKIHLPDLNLKLGELFLNSKQHIRVRNDDLRHLDICHTGH